MGAKLAALAALDPTGHDDGTRGILGQYGPWLRDARAHGQGLITFYY